jgi:hypothetical protein
VIDIAIFKLLDGALANPADVALYKGVKAIFTADLPDDAALPAVVINEIGGRDWGTRAKQGGECMVDVTVLDHKKESQAGIRALAWKVRKLINRSELPELAILGYGNFGCYADPPRKAPDEFGFPGFTIQVMVRVLES